MKRLQFLLAAILSFLFLAPISAHKLYAQTNITNDSEFYSEMDVIYKIDELGQTTAHFDVSIENLVTDRYASQYQIRLQGVKPENAFAKENDKSLPLTIEEQNGESVITTIFPDALVGKGETRTFSVEFLDKSLTAKTGEVWEITLPQLRNIHDKNGLSVALLVPSSFGKVAYMSPTPETVAEEDGWQVFVFDPDKTTVSGISAAFGQFQVFSFDITYHLENPIAKEASLEVAIPPDTAFQKVLYSSLEPKPASIKRDDDGNWIASFTLKSRQKTDVHLAGHVQLFASQRVFAQPTELLLKTNLEERKYWEVKDPQIVQIAQELKTPRAIFDYVVKTLTYNYDRVRPNAQRQGAKTALYSPLNSICTEFTDLFVTLARAAGIPAREVNGYAYTENQELQPLSLVADVLHSWPEYWDEEKQVWVPVDPTWTDTTGGMDYFNQLDLRHFAFVIHGADAEKPYPPGSYKLGSNPQKDVFVAFSQLPDNRVSKPTINIKKLSALSFGNVTYRATIINNGPHALYNQPVFIEIDGKPLTSESIEFLAPFANTNIEFVVPFGISGQQAPETISVKVVSEEGHIKTNKNNVITVFVISLMIILLAAVTVLFFYIFKAQQKKK